MALGQYYADVLAQGPELVVIGGRFRVNGTSAPDLVVDGTPNRVAITVAYEDTGKTYTVTLPKIGGSLPQELVAITTSLAFEEAVTAPAVDSVDKPGYVYNSYSPTTGAFVIINSKTTTGTAVAVFPDNAEIHFIAMFRNQKRLGQTV